MAAPKGNKNAVGNRGGRSKTNTDEYRKMVAKYRTKVLEDALHYLESDPEFKKQLILKSITAVLPKELDWGDSKTPVLVVPAETINKYATDPGSSKDSGEQKTV